MGRVYLTISNQPQHNSRTPKQPQQSDRKDGRRQHDPSIFDEAKYVIWQSDCVHSLPLRRLRCIQVLRLSIVATWWPSVAIRFRCFVHRTQPLIKSTVRRYCPFGAEEEEDSCVCVWPGDAVITKCTTVNHQFHSIRRHPR